MAVIGYARAGMDGETLDAQVAALAAAGAARVLRETADGAAGAGGELARGIKSLSGGDILLITRLDRLARSTRELVKTLDAIARAGAGFRSLAEPWADATTPLRGSILSVIGGLAAFERDLIRVRTSEGRERAQARGQQMERPSALSEHQRREGVAALAAGTATQADLARRYKVSQSTISRLADRQNPAPARPRLDAGTERVARAFMRRLDGRYAVREAILYGSRARQTHNSDSDADIAVVLQGESGNRWEMTRDLSGIAFDVLLETGIRVQPLPLWEDELKRPERFGNPALIANIQRDGVRL